MYLGSRQSYHAEVLIFNLPYGYSTTRLPRVFQHVEFHQSHFENIQPWCMNSASNAGLCLSESTDDNFCDSRLNVNIWIWSCRNSGFTSSPPVRSLIFCNLQIKSLLIYNFILPGVMSPVVRAIKRVINANAWAVSGTSWWVSGPAAYKLEYSACWLLASIITKTFCRCLISKRNSTVGNGCSQDDTKEHAWLMIICMYSWPQLHSS